jgi:nicotinate-nucleotide--dimethylbenzimidazole phosphoribosyltransferase
MNHRTAPINAVDRVAAQKCRTLLDAKTKPRNSLGQLEELACTLAGIRRAAIPDLGKSAIVVMAADHGVAANGVSAYPSEVTAQMVLNFARGGAAINVLARQAGAQLLVVDMGVANPVAQGQGIRDCRVGKGTRDISVGPAMSPSELEQAIAVGFALAAELADAGVGVVGLGEMGIGNTTSAAALVAAFTGASIECVVGSGTGIDEAGRIRKQAIVERALAVNAVALGEPHHTLAALGGFEIAGLTGMILGAAHRGLVVLCDGYITGAAALAAVAMRPEALEYLVAAHRSHEPGHRIVLQTLKLEPLLQLALRLGEGTGAALALPLLHASVSILAEMATFESAGVSDTGRGVD